MSQIGGKLSKFYGEFNIVSTDLLIILLNFVATDVYALFRKSINKICNIMFKKTADLAEYGSPYLPTY